METDNIHHKETTAIIAASFEIDGYDDTKEYSQDEVIQVLANRVAEFMENRFEQLMSLMYTMDINESKVRKALAPNAQEPANIGIAKLIYQRQLQRVHTKHEYAQKGPKDWEDF